MRKLLFLIILFSIFQLKGQFSETIVSDRPGQSFSPHTVGKGVLQFQQGVDYFSFEFVDDFQPPSGNAFEGKLENTDWIWNNQIRYGFHEQWEVNLGIAYRWSYNTLLNEGPNPDPALDGETNLNDDFDRLELGIRHNLLDGGKDKLSLGGQITVDLYNFYTGAYYDYLDLRFMASLPFLNIHKLSSNVALRASNGSNLLYTLNYSLNFNRFATFVEMYGDTPLSSSIADPGDTEVYFDFGASYLVCDALQLDVLAGLNHPYAYTVKDAQERRAFFVGGGLSWRIQTN